jgi:uncharacterized protein
MLGLCSAVTGGTTGDLAQVLLDLSRMRSAHDRIERTYSPSDFETADEDYTVAAPVALAFDVYKDKDQFRLVGRVGTTLRLTCSRCLESFERPVDASFDLLFLPHGRNTGEGEIEVEEDDLATAFYRDETIDLNQLMREQFYLALPMKPLCQEGCRGLCPVCGTNLNQATCSCDAKWDDPRLAGLKALLDPDRK